jgi:hypothetical protein
MTEKKGLASLQKLIKDKKLAVAPHDKGLGFVTLEPKKLKEKSYAAFQNVTSDTPDETIKLEGQIQRKLLKLKKDGKISDKDYNQIRPSGCVPPSSTPQIKAHKPTKDYPARNIISHRGCPQQALASYLIPLLRPSLKIPHLPAKNYSDFVKKIKNIKLNSNKILISYDAEALFPSTRCLYKMHSFTSTTFSKMTSL